MFTIKEIASEIGLQTNTLRYWLKKNNEDFERNFYDFNLWDLIKKIKISKKTSAKRSIERFYEQYIVFDMEEFKDEFTKYLKYIENIKYKKKIGNLYWTHSAIDCYSCNMDCNKCFNKNICLNISNSDDEPPMKNTVKKLLEKIGKPPI